MASATKNGARINPGTANGTERRKTWVRGAAGAAVLAAAGLLAAHFAGRDQNPGNAAATPSASRSEEESSSAPRAASLQTAAATNPPQAVSAAESLSPQAKTEKVRALLDEVREALSGNQLDRAGRSLAVALRLDPNSQLVAYQKKALEEKREKVRQGETRERVADYHEQGLRALSASDVEGALRAFEAARELDLSDGRTFRLIEHAHRVRHRLEARQRRLAFREGATSPPSVSATSDGMENSVPRERGAFPAPAGAAAPARPGEYVVQPEDVLQISVFEEPDLATKARVSRDGEITFPLLGQVALAGLTVVQAQERLAQLLGENYLVHPQVQVFVDKPRNVFVTGEVHRPGSYPVSVERETTIMEVLSMAGGYTEDADLNGTRIIRMENGQKRTLRVRVGDIIRKGDKSQDVGVLPDDIVFVPESFF